MTDQQAVVCDAELLMHLRYANPDEVDLLVDVITDFGKGRAGLDANLKKTLVMARHDISADRYPAALRQSIALELQQFGGNSAMNLARRLRGKSAVPYKEIVDDVYKKLNGTGAAGKSTEQKEREIALALFGEGWRDLPFVDRFERCTSTKVLSGWFKINDAIAKDAAGLVIGLSGASSAALYVATTVGPRLIPGVGLLTTVGLGVQSATSEAYRITVPFVAQMGWIRLRRDAQVREPALLASADTPRAGGLIHAESALTLRDDSGAPLLKLSVLESKPASAGRKIAESQISVLNPLLSNVPGLAAGAEVARDNYVLCSLPFDALTKSASSEDGMRAWVTQGTRIKEHAELFSPEGLQNVLLSGAAWNALSSAVGQKHLHDINEQLTAIKRQLDDLQTDLDNLRLNKLAGLIDYVQELLDHSHRDGIDQLAAPQLENNLPMLSELDHYFAGKMAHELGVVEGRETGKLMGNDKAREEISASLVSMARWIRGAVQLAQLKVVNNGLLFAATQSERYRTGAVKALDSLEQLTAVVARSRQVYGAQMAMSKSRVSSPSAEDADLFALQLQGLSEDLQTGTVDTRQLYEGLFSQADRSVLLYVKGGQIAEAQLLA